MSEVEHIPHSAGQFSSGSVEYLQASTLFHAQARVHQPPALSFPRHRRHRNRQTVLQGAAGATTPTTPRPILNPVPGLEAQPGQAGSTAVASSVPPSEPLRPYTAFDEISCSRTLQAHPSWEPRRYVTHAITSSRLPGCSIGRLMHAHVAGYAVPQVAITQDRRFSARRAVVFDLRDLGHDIETLDVFPSQTVVQVLQLLRTLADANLVLHHLRSGNVHCFVNWDQAAPDAPLGGGADVVELRTVAGRSLRPPTPPLPAAESACSLPAEDPQPLLVGPYRPPHPARRWQRHLGERVGTVMIDSSPELLTCSVFDPLHHAEILSHQACHHPGALLTHAMVAHKDLGGIIDGRVIAFPLPAWPLPQVCVHSWVQASYVVIPVQVGDKVCTLSIMREASVFELMLMLEGRCGIPRSYRHLVAKGWVAVYINEQRIREIFERDSFLFADTARIDAVPALAPSAAPDMLFPDTQLAPRPDGFLTVHRPGFAPSQTYIHPFRTPDDVKSDLRDQGLLGRDGSLQVPLVSPVLVDGGAHLVSLSHEQVLDGRCYMVVDLRRVVHPPFVMFWTTPVVPQFAVAHFEDFLLEEFPSIAPVVNVFVDDIRADAVQMSRRFPFVTVLGAPSDPSHLGCLPLPAVQYSRELLMARPGHRSRAMRLSCALRPPPALTSTSTTTPPVIRSEQDAAAGSNPPVLPTSAEGASSVAGGIRLNPCEDNWQFQYFTVFDSDLQMRFLEKRPDWTTADCTREARRLSRHLPAPHRVVALTSPLPHLPVPQFVLSPNQLIPSSHAVVCDFRPLGLGVCVLDLSFGTTFFEGLSHEGHKPGRIQALSRLTRGEAGVSMGGAIGDVFRQVPMETACVLAFVWDRPSHVLPPSATPVSTTLSANDDHARSLAEVVMEIADPPWFRLTIHLTGTGPSSDPSALFTQAPTASTWQSLTQLASERIRLFRPHQFLRLQFPAFTPVGSGSLLHVFAFCDSEGDSASTMALFDGRELDERTPAVFAASIPRPSSVCELAAVAHTIWPDIPAPAALRVNGEAVSSVEDTDRVLPLVQPLPRNVLPVGIRPSPFRPVPTTDILERLPGLGMLTPPVPTSTSTTTGAVASLSDRVVVAFAFPGVRPRAISLHAGFHFADVLWDIVSDPNPTFSMVDAYYWQVVACPRLFPERSGGSLVLVTVATLDPFVDNVWVDIRTDEPVLFVAEVGEGRSREELLDRFCPGRRDIRLYLDGSLAGDVPAIRPGCVLTFCRDTWECTTLPLSTLHILL